jgi:AraC family transcriptional regulator
VVDEERHSLTSVAREFGVHPVHLARSFRRFLGCTFSDYVAKLRIRRALELLLIENQAIVDVANACGFADHAHLSRTFKKVTGLTPRAFRLRARGDAEHASSIKCRG